MDDVDDELQAELDSERQTVADVVEFCEACFPELAAWDTESSD